MKKKTLNPEHSKKAGHGIGASCGLLRWSSGLWGLTAIAMFLGVMSTPSLSAPTVREVRAFTILGDYTESEFAEFAALVRKVDDKRPDKLHIIYIVKTEPELSTKEAAEFMRRYLK